MKKLKTREELLDYIAELYTEMRHINSWKKESTTDVPYEGFYRKYARVKAVQAGKERVGQHLSTIMSDGHVEVKDAVIQDPTDWIVTNPKGEAYIVKDAKFKKTYELEVGADGKHAPKGGDNHFIMVPEDIEFMVPWGEGGSLIPFALKKGGYLNVTDMDKNLNKKPIEELDIYGVQRDEFKETYAECSFTGEFYDPKLREAFGQEKKGPKREER